MRYKAFPSFPVPTFVARFACAAAVWDWTWEQDSSPNSALHPRPAAGVYRPHARCPRSAPDRARYVFIGRRPSQRLRGRAVRRARSDRRRPPHGVPGMMDPETWALRVPQGAAGRRVAEVGSFNPNAQAMWGINPHSAHVGVTRLVGITHVLSSPTGGLISGQSAVINLAGWTVPDMTVVPKAAVVINLPRAGFSFGRGGFQALMARMQQAGESDPDRLRERQMDSIRAILRDAEATVGGRRARRDRTLPRPSTTSSSRRSSRRSAGRCPCCSTAERAPDSRGDHFRARDATQPVILGGRDAWQVTDLLSRTRPVILTSVMTAVPRDEPYDVNYSAPAKLHRAGVRFGITSAIRGRGAHLPYRRHAASFGLPKDALCAPSRSLRRRSSRQ